ncbi:MAG: acetylglutamate kinase [Candidatus Omnitrophica bacterium]|nr:acetylglutamate kinase [Candidatus Omnitrophota bacterium]
MKEFIKKADVLIEALPYIRRFRGKVVVIKYGGSALNNDLKPTTIEDIIFLHFAGIKVVVVHGGGPFINQALIGARKKANFIDGLRVTDKETLDIVEDVLINKVNKDILEMIQSKGAKAKGLTDKEADFIKAGQIKKELGFVGEVIEVSPVLVDLLKNEDCIYVLAPLARDKGQLLNINADHFAGEIASSIPAEKIIFMTDVSGIMRNPEDPSTLIPTFKKGDIKEFIRDGIIGKGMIPKVRAGETALERGVPKVHIIDGRIKHALLLEVFTDKGIGTEIIK